MTRDQALDTLTRCAIESRQAMEVLRATHPLRPMGVVESESLRAGGGRTGVLPLGVAVDPLTATPSPVCGLQYDADTCVLPLGHEGECEDQDGNHLEIAF